MSKLKKVAISVGDFNGVASEIILNSHDTIATLCSPVYCCSQSMMKQAAKLLDCELPQGMLFSSTEQDFVIQTSQTTQESGLYSFNSFTHAIKMAEDKKVDAIVTLPINKEAWSLAGLKHKGHTDYLRKHFNQEAIMMLGCDKLYVALFTEHIPLQDVAKGINEKLLFDFLLNFYHATHFDNVGVLGLNPHAGDGGVLGDEEKMISQAINQANARLKKDIFHGPLVSDTAFTPHALQSCNRIIAMYHDQGLAPLKALYFDESINVSLHLPIIRTSVDHGTAFDIAYKNKKPKNISYINAIRHAVLAI